MLSIDWCHTVDEGSTSGTSMVPVNNFGTKRNIVIHTRGQSCKHVPEDSVGDVVACGVQSLFPSQGHLTKALEPVSAT
jgi:hypothetical protein